MTQWQYQNTNIEIRNKIEKAKSELKSIISETMPNMEALGSAFRVVIEFVSIFGFRVSDFSLPRANLFRQIYFRFCSFGWFSDFEFCISDSLLLLLAPSGPSTAYAHVRRRRGRRLSDRLSSSHLGSGPCAGNGRCGPLGRTARRSRGVAIAGCVSLGDGDGRNARAHGRTITRH